MVGDLARALISFKRPSRRCKTAMLCAMYRLFKIFTGEYGYASILRTQSSKPNELIYVSALLQHSMGQVIRSLASSVCVCGGGMTSRGSMRSYSWYRNLQSRRNPKLGPGSITCVDPLSRQKNFESTLIPKCPTVNFCRRFGKIRPCSFETLSRTSRAIYRHIKFCHISTGNINMLAWKLEVHFRKLAKSHILSDSKSPDYTQQTFSSSTFIFSWHLT